MIAIRYSILILLAVFLPETVRGADEVTEVKDPDLVFDSEGDAALYATVSGSWKAYEFEGEKMIRLTPEPVRQSRVDLGATLNSYDISVSAKILGKEKRRLKPRMGVGIFGEYGYTLRLAPGRNMLELVQYGEVIAESPCRWLSAQWFYLELTMEAKGNHWRLTGKVWPSGQAKPDKPILQYDAFPDSLTHPLSGRAFLTGAPFNGLPIFYDEVVVRKNAGKK